jgi:signal transduction histidine kinase
MPAWSERITKKPVDCILESASAKNLRNLHLVIIVLLFVVLAFFYYIEKTALIAYPLFSDSLFTGVHDLHRILFLVPIVYASLVFRVKGSLIASFVFLCVVLPRAFYLSPFPHAIARALISVVSSALIGSLFALWLNLLEREKRDKEHLATLYKELQKYHKQLQEDQEMIIRAEKLASLGKLAASIAHELNNPLSGVLIYIRLLIKKITGSELNNEQALDYLSRIDFEVTRCTKLIRNILDFSSQSETKLQEVDVNEVLNRAIDLTIHARSADTTVEKRLQPVPKILGDPDQLEEVFINLIINAFQSMPNGGSLTLSTYPQDHYVKTAFKDTGYGIAPEYRKMLFTPFFSTKKEVKGVGLGLAVSYGIIQRLKGTIEVESEPNNGSTFTVCIPFAA